MTEAYTHIANMIAKMQTDAHLKFESTSIECTIKINVQMLVNTPHTNCRNSNIPFITNCVLISLLYVKVIIIYMIPKL